MVGESVPKQTETMALPFSAAELETGLRELLFIRHFEEKCNLAYRAGKAGGYLHVYIGMEPLAIAWMDAIKKGYDYVITAYRDHGQALLLGCEPVSVMAEIMGRQGGMSRGKGGSMHLYDISKGFYGGWGIVGGHTALAGGLALAAKYRKEDRVTICYLGDGAANAGVFFETMNMCGLWDLPIVFIIENNLYAMGTALERHAADPEMHKRGMPFGFKHERIEGHDLVQHKLDAQRIVDWVRENQRPYLVEVMTYRNLGHGAADNDRQLYRTREEEEQFMKSDPLKVFTAYLLKHNIMTQEKIEAIDAELEAQCQRIYEEADHSPHPEPDEVFHHVYTDMNPEVGH